jgi:hypothetical protein
VVPGVGGSLRGGAGSVEGWRLGSAWWSEIVRIRDEFGGLRPGWFGESVLRKVGDGTKTIFWSDPWLGRTPSSVRFRRLFDLAETRLGGGLTEAWVWRRQLWVWEKEMLRECQTLLLTVNVQVGSLDRWLWRPAPDSGYTVCDC